MLVSAVSSVKPLLNTTLTIQFIDVESFDLKWTHDNYTLFKSMATPKTTFIYMYGANPPSQCRNYSTE